MLFHTLRCLPLLDDLVVDGRDLMMLHAVQDEDAMVEELPAALSLADVAEADHGEEEISNLSIGTLADEQEDDPMATVASELQEEEASLPPKMLPGFWPCFFLAVMAAFHVLFMFMSHW